MKNSMAKVNAFPVEGVRARWSRPASLALLTAAALIADYVTGPAIQFPIFFVIPVVLAARWQLKGVSFALAVLMPVCRFFFTFFWDNAVSFIEGGINTVLRIAVFVLIAHLTGTTVRQAARLRKEVKMLSGLLPICSSCKKIRNKQGAYEPIEEYIRDHSEAEFTHGLCDACMAKLYPEYVKRSKE